MSEEKQFRSFAEFYPFYLDEHRDHRCRRCHFVGSALVILVLVLIATYQAWAWLWLIPVIGYGFAWFGHLLFEKNRPATFKYPLYSLIGDWVMFKDMLSGKIEW